MDSSGLGGGFLSGPNGGLLDLESSIHRHPTSQLGHSSIPHQHHMNMMSGVDSEHHPITLMELKGSTPKCVSVFGKGKAVAPMTGNHGYNMSEEDEPSYMEDGSGENYDGAKGKKGSPWQRMKWTDNVVKLLIAVVACVGDDGMIADGEGPKRKSGILQKKGKWKTVSKIMISKGCHVSPQQCEDKFNDLNKRYKRLNDILGRGTSCRVVENPALMDSMPHLSAKAKDDVRKILSSKHLFYTEMCAYHKGQRIPDCHDIDLQGYSLPLGRCSKDNNASEEEEEAEDNHDSDDDELDNEDDNNNDNDGERMGEFGDRRKVSDEDCHFWTSPQESFEGEMAGYFQDPTKSLWERREWLKKQTLHFQEQRVNIQAQALELEKQRFRWLRYCSKKDRELERLRLENERMKLENERKVLLLRQKELEIDLRRSEASLEHSSLGVDRVQGRDQIDLGRHS
ncbi:sequence-specific DNA binding transcription factor [Parasponia andersonii]|uniref:Sequence-specific DNA binding transcription factor n=1 Tax=Parasponia andersonii TaxID=3476 RepID=A0A2P5DZZ1_PARAD|nr:sequence-specific DNA binding transcription factor [Parasponia andersonii]